jgi:hypothetical protein
MTDIFEEEKAAPVEDDVLELETEDENWQVLKLSQGSDARRRLEDLLYEKKLKEDLDDYYELDNL